MGLAITALAVSIGVGVWQWAVSRELRELVRELEERGAVVAKDTTAVVNGPAAGLAPASAVEVAKLREEIERLSARTQAVARLAVKNSEGAVLLNLRPAGAWKNSGRGSPASAIETLLWAADGGDVEALASSILLDDEAKARAQAILDRLPEAARLNYGTPEKLIALLMARDADIRAMQVLSESRNENEALVNVRVQKGDGKTKDEGYAFRQVGDAWRLVIPGKAVDKYGKKLTEPPKKGG